MGLFKSTEKALADWPRMTVLKRQGGVRIYGSYAGPATEFWGGFHTFSISLMVIYFAILEGKGYGVAAGIAAVMWVGWLVFGRSISTALLGRNLDVRILPKAIQVKSRRYDRNAISGFRVERHRDAVREAREEQRRGRRMDPIFRHALEVVMDYGEKRVRIAAMPDKDQERAEALVYRLQNIHQNLESYVGGGKGPPGGGGGGGNGGNGGDDFGPPPDIR